MDMHQIRLKNLLLVIEKAGSQARLADYVGIKSSYISQIKSPKHPTNMGNDIARRIEKAMNLPFGWMDNLHDEPEGLLIPLDCEHNADFVGVAKSFRPVPVAGTAKLGDDGDYSLEQVDANMVLDVPTSDPNACALRVVGDSMHPAIRHGWYVVIEPSVDPRHGLYVAVETHSGKRMVKELLSMDNDVVRLESVNPKHGRTTLEAKEVKTVQAVTMIVQASKARMIVT
jgi:hypothetical protein